MKVQITTGRHGEVFLQITRVDGNSPIDDTGEDSEAMNSLAKLDCCENARHWDADTTKPLKSVTIRLHDPRVEILAGAAKKLNSVLVNLGLD